MKDEHVFKAVFPPVLVTAAALELRRIPERAEKNVPDREIRKVVRVMPELMVNAVRFGPLKKKSNPRGSINVPVIEEFADGNRNGVIAGGCDTASK